MDLNAKYDFESDSIYIYATMVQETSRPLLTYQLGDISIDVWEETDQVFGVEIVNASQGWGPINWDVLKRSWDEPDE